MDTEYFVMHPTLGITAVVHAPSTEKARTTFLDWLERNNHIRRADRQAFRKNMVAERLEGGEVPSDVVLHYGYSDAPTRRASYSPSSRDIIENIVRGDTEAEADLALTDLLSNIQSERTMGEPPEEDLIEDMLSKERSEPAERPGSKMMPVQKVMLEGYTE